MRLSVAILCVAVPVFVNAMILVRLREHRTDLQPTQSGFDGSSRIWQVNVMRRSNYTPSGQRLLQWYYLSLVALAAGFVAVAMLAFA
jgi:hypothetical protein